MAEQTIPLAGADFSTNIQNARWDPNPKVAIIAGLSRAGTAPELFGVTIFSADRLGLDFGAGDIDLTDLFELSGSVILTVGGVSHTIEMNGQDTSDPYNLLPPTSGLFSDLYQTLVGQTDISGSIILRDFVGAVPSFADTGDDADWTRNTAIAAITIPRATGGPAPTYASVGDEPDGIDIVLPTETADGSITGTPTALGAGSIIIRAANSEGTADWTQNYAVPGDGIIIIRATNSEGSDVWTLAYTLRTEMDGTFSGELDGELSPDVTLGAFPLLLSDSDDTGLDVETKALMVASAAGTAGSNFFYRDADRGGTDTPLDGDLVFGPDGTVISAFRHRTEPWLQLNDSNNPAATDIGDYYDAGGAGSDLIIYLQTAADGEVSFPAAGNVPYNRGDQVRFTLPVAAQTLLNNIALGDRWIFKTARLIAAEVDATFDGELDGELSPDVALGDEPFLEADAAFDGEIDGELSPGVGLGHIPLAPDATFDGELDGTLAPSVALGAVPPPHQVFDLGANPFDVGADWLGALLIDPVFVVGGGTAYLRRFGISGNSTRLDVSVSDTGSFVGAGPELVPEWEDWEGAIVFDADGGGITLKGPNHPDNSFSDPSEPYFWTPDNGSAFRDWYLTEPQNVTVLQSRATTRSGRGRCELSTAR